MRDRGCAKFSLGKGFEHTVPVFRSKVARPLVAVDALKMAVPAPPRPTQSAATDIRVAITARLVGVTRAARSSRPQAHVRDLTPPPTRGVMSRALIRSAVGEPAAPYEGRRDEAVVRRSVGGVPPA